MTYHTRDVALRNIANEIARSREQTLASVQGHVESMLIKVDEYRYEEEVRIIYVAPQSAVAVPEMIPIAIDPNELFEEVVLDPRLGSAQAIRRQDEIRELGFTGSVRPSDLYQGAIYLIPLD